MPAKYPTEFSIMWKSKTGLYAGAMLRYIPGAPTNLSMGVLLAALKITNDRFATSPEPMEIQPRVVAALLPFPSSPYATAGARNKTRSNGNANDLFEKKGIKLHQTLGSSLPLCLVDLPAGISDYDCYCSNGDEQDCGGISRIFRMPYPASMLCLWCCGCFPPFLKASCLGRLIFRFGKRQSRCNNDK